MSPIPRTVTIRQVCRDLGLKLKHLRALIARDPEFPPVQWTGERSGILFREDLEEWIAQRHLREARRREQQQRQRDFLHGAKSRNSQPGKPLPDFLRRGG